MCALQWHNNLRVLCFPLPGPESPSLPPLPHPAEGACPLRRCSGTAHLDRPAFDQCCSLQRASSAAHTMLLCLGGLLQQPACVPQGATNPSLPAAPAARTEALKGPCPQFHSRCLLLHRLRARTVRSGCGRSAGSAARAASGGALPAGLPDSSAAMRPHTVMASGRQGNAPTSSRACCSAVSVCGAEGVQEGHRRYDVAGGQEADRSVAKNRQLTGQMSQPAARAVTSSAA